MSKAQLGLIGSAVAVYALAVACVLWPRGATGASGGNRGDGGTSELLATADPVPSGVGSLPRPPGGASVEGLPFRAVGMQIQRVDWIDKYKQSVDEIAQIGADAVLFVLDTRQENGGSSKIWLDMRLTPTTEQLVDLIRHAKGRNLRVILMPIVLLDNPRGNEWRGKIAPEGENGWSDWWDSYRQKITHFAIIAQNNNADMLVVGSELVSTEQNVKEWTKTIQAVRQIFKGKLTYSANWDAFRPVPFWDQLDLIGMNSYWKMGEEDQSPSVEQIKSRWRQIQQDLLPFLHKTKKPLMFLEIGWFSQRNVVWEPWDYTRSVEEEPIDLEVQKRLYQAFFESWHGKPELGGFSVWEWTPGDGGTDNSGYTPENKPAEQVLREWLAKPRWQVKVN